MGLGTRGSDRGCIVGVGLHCAMLCGGLCCAVFQAVSKYFIFFRFLLNYSVAFLHYATNMITQYSIARHALRHADDHDNAVCFFAALTIRFAVCFLPDNMHYLQGR